MKARGVTVAWSHNIQNLAIYAKGKGVLMTKRQALDFCKLLPNDTIFYWEESWRSKEDAKSVIFVLKQATYK